MRRVLLSILAVVGALALLVVAALAIVPVFFALLVATAALAVALGAVSLASIVASSAVVGFSQRRLGAALRAFVFQLGALFGVPCGFFVVTVLAVRAEEPVDLPRVVSVVGMGGVTGGMLLVGLCDRVWGWLISWWRPRPALVGAAVVVHQP